MSKKICVSFDYEKDKKYYYLLNAWNKNPRFELSIIDCTPSEIQSERIDRIKAVLTEKISNASTLLVIVGRDADKNHPDRYLIGYRNWQNFEIAKAKDLGKKIVAVKIDRGFTSPTELLNANVSWAMSFTEDAIMKALIR